MSKNSPQPHFGQSFTQRKGKVKNGSFCEERKGRRILKGGQTTHHPFQRVGRESRSVREIGASLVVGGRGEGKFSQVEEEGKIEINTTRSVKGEGKDSETRICKKSLRPPQPTSASSRNRSDRGGRLSS